MGKLVVLMITAFVDMVGLLMIIPLLPFYAKHLGANGFVVGLLVALFATATNAGVALGPLFGSFASHWQRSGPGLLAAALCVCNIVFAFFFLSESRDMVEAKAVGRKQIRSRDAVLRVVTHSGEAPSRL